MTSGNPMHDDEKLYIETHIEDGPGHIAFMLGKLYPQHNGGFRSRTTIQQYIYRIGRGGEITLSLKIPTWMFLAAKKQGMARHDLVMTAQQAIREKIT